MKILFTGASSFTGLWFVKALRASGHAVTATLTKPVASYQGLRKERVDQVASLATVSDGITFGSQEFLDLMKQDGGFDLICHHAADASNYNSIDFDATKALANNTMNLHQTLSEFKAHGGKAVVLTGSVFEADEGRGDSDSDTRAAFNPYGLSKAMTSQAFRYYTSLEGLPLGKFVIPNPFGPWEEPRFTAYLVNTWRKGGIPEVKTPDYVRDNVPVDLLAACYGRFVRDVADRRETFVRSNPSCYAETQGQFAQRFAEQMRRRLPMTCRLTLGTQTDFSQPLVRVNTDPATALVPDWDETDSWNAIAAYYEHRQ